MTFRSTHQFLRFLSLLFAVLCVTTSLVAAEPPTMKRPSIRLRATYGLNTYRLAEFVAGETISVRAEVHGGKADPEGNYHFATEATLVGGSNKTIGTIKLQKHKPNRYGGLTTQLSLAVPQDAPEGTYRLRVTVHDLIGSSESTSELEIKLLPAQSQGVTELRLVWEPATSLRDAQTYLVAAVSPELIGPGRRDVQCTMIVWDEHKKIVGKPVSATITGPQKNDENGRPYNLSLQLPALTPGNYQIRLLAPNELGREATQYQIDYRIPAFASVVDAVR
ncbi:hypothetical protein [Blastopirellula marina]|nr:hypothetical protein [Blastopirellula marina]